MHSIVLLDSGERLLGDRSGRMLAPRALDMNTRRVPPELAVRLQGFRARYPYRHVTIAGTPWQHIDTALGRDVVLVLTGAAGVAEMSWQLIEHLAQRHRVIAPDYPALDTMAGLADGIAAVLDGARVTRAHVIGGSYGGLVAQVFVRRHAERVSSLTLSHTVLPDRETAEQLAALVRWMNRLPAWVLRSLFKRRMATLFPKAQDHPEVVMSKALFGEAVGRLTKAQILGLTRRVVDVGTGSPFAPEDLDGWPGRILLLMGTDDPATPEGVREALKATYPRARTRTFSGAGHLTAILMQDEYLAAIDEFLKVQPAAS